MKRNPKLELEVVRATIVWNPVERAPRDGRHLIFAAFGSPLWEQVWWSSVAEDFINERGYAHLYDKYGRIKATHYTEINVPRLRPPRQAPGKGMR